VPPVSGGRNTLTSILVPSKVVVVPLQARMLPFAGLAVQVTAPPYTVLNAACAAGAAKTAPKHITADAISKRLIIHILLVTH